MARSILLTLLFSAVLHAQSAADLYSDRRKDLQGQFARAQKPIYPDPAKATEADLAEMVKVNEAINSLRKDFVDYEGSRYRNWYRKSYWYYGKSDYWEAGPGARRLLDKLSVQIAKVKSISAKEVGPFGRPDLNDSQKLLDAIREGISIDAELEQIVKVYLKR